jgi:FtsH-binding integral membrane protein
LLFWKPWLKLSLLNGFASYGALATALIAIYTTKDLLGFVVFLSVYYLLFLAMVQTTGLRHQLGWISVLAITTSCNFIFSVILLHNEPATLALLLMGWAGVLAVLGLRQKQELVGLSKGFQLMALGKLLGVFLRGYAAGLRLRLSLAGPS